MDCNKARRQADELGNLSNTLMYEREKLTNLLARIKNEWCGPGSEAFQDQLQKLIDDVELVRYHLLDVAYTMAQTANAAENGTVST